MIFRILDDNRLKRVDIEIPDETLFVETQNKGKIQYIQVDENELPQNPYFGITEAEYKLDSEGTIVIDYNTMLENFKESVIKSINNTRDYLISQGFQWIKDNGDGTTTTYEFGLNELDREGLMTLAIAVLLGQTENLYFITKDNITVPLTPDEAKSLALTGEQRASYIVYTARQYKDRVIAATSFDEIIAILDEVKNNF